MRPEYQTHPYVGRRVSNGHGIEGTIIGYIMRERRARVEWDDGTVYDIIVSVRTIWI